MSSVPNPIPSSFECLAENLTTKQQEEFRKVVRELGLKSSDEELAKLLKALLLYRSYYEIIPSAIIQAHNLMRKDFLQWREEIRGLNGHVTAATQQYEALRKALSGFENAIAGPLTEAVVSEMQKRIGTETLSGLKIVARDINAITSTLRFASSEARQSVSDLQFRSLRTIWLRAFTCSLLFVIAVWWFYLKHTLWWTALNSN